jgi:hypothetical protein
MPTGDAMWEEKMNDANRNRSKITNSLPTWPIQIWRVGFFYLIC